jgi:hypothetical protein
VIEGDCKKFEETRKHYDVAEEVEGVDGNPPVFSSTSVPGACLECSVGLNPTLRDIALISFSG